MMSKYKISFGQVKLQFKRSTNADLQTEIKLLVHKPNKRSNTK